MQLRKSKNASGLLQSNVLPSRAEHEGFTQGTHAHSRRKARLGAGTFLGILGKVHISEHVQFKVIGHKVTLQRVLIKI